MDRRNFLETSFFGAGAVLIPQMNRKEKKRKPTSFGIVTDIHYADTPDNLELNRYYRQSLPKLEEFVEVMNAEKVDFVIELGDLKDQGNLPDETRTLDFLRKIEQVFCKFRGPVYHVLGNHDHDSISKLQFLKNIKNEGFAEAKNYYSFRNNGVHFIVLDANYTTDGTEYDHGNYDWTKAYVPSHQLEWLKKELKKHREPVILFIHHQLDSSEAEDLRHCPINADEVRKILEASGKVKVVFQGHYHKGSVHSINGICYYTLKSLVEGSGMENNNYAIVRIDDDGLLSIKGFRKTISLEIGSIKNLIG